MFLLQPDLYQVPPCHVWLEPTMKHHLLLSYIYRNLSLFPIFFIRPV